MPVSPHRLRARAFAAFLSLCALAGCAQRNDANTGPSPASLPSEYRPAGVAPGSAVKGVYPDHWTAQQATFGVDVPRTARTLRVEIDVPAAFYKPGEQGVTLQLGSGTTQSKHGLPVGRQTLTFSVPGSARGKSVGVKLLPDATFVPSKLGLSSDARQLGVILYGVSFG
ncbi:MAG: hypothetical protein JO036_20325 [Candidatus Eremiobacteraeota bacterium]|nr:hypothetical protein [Candidatus Eremiobacteraeota bacterium]